MPYAIGFCPFRGSLIWKINPYLLPLRELHLVVDIHIAFGYFFKFAFEQAAFEWLDMIDE